MYIRVCTYVACWDDADRRYTSSDRREESGIRNLESLSVRVSVCQCVSVILPLVGFPPPCVRFLGLSGLLFLFREELVVGLFVSVERNEVEVRQARCGVKNTLEEAIVLIKNLVDWVESWIQSLYTKLQGVWCFLFFLWFSSLFILSSLDRELDSHNSLWH